MRRAVAGALLAVVLGAVPAAAQIYRWTDSAGVIHFTTNPESIPEEYRDAVRAIDASRPPSEIPQPPAASPSATIPLPAGDSPIMVAALLNGVPLTLMLDTGADRTMLAPSALARAGLDASAGRPVRVLGVTGTSDAFEVTLARLDVAGARLGPVAVVVHELPAPNVDGLLGRDLLHAFTLTVDAASGHAILTPR
jgi:predicted aspartyl protease